MGSSAFHHGPFIGTAHAFTAELPTEPVDVVDEDNRGDAQTGGLDGRGARGFIAAGRAAKEMQTDSRKKKEKGGMRAFMCPVAWWFGLLEFRTMVCPLSFPSVSIEFPNGGGPYN
jgi:hypothetical protein